MKIFLLLIILFSQNIEATLTCTASSSTSTSLLLGSNSLAHHEVQDQDGLGTCFANTLSTMIEAAMPGNPPVSFQQIALAYGLNSHSRPGEERSDTSYVSTTGRRELIMEGGFVCPSFNAVRERTRGRLCHRDTVPVERLGYEQSTMIRSLSTFYDQFTEAMENSADEAERTALRSNIRNTLLNLNRASEEDATLSCTHPMSNPNPNDLIETVQNLCLDTFTQIQELEAQISDSETSSRVRSRLEREVTQKRELLTRLGTTHTETSSPVQGSNNGTIPSDIIVCDINPLLLTEINEHYFRDLESGVGIERALRNFERRTHLTHHIVPEHDRWLDRNLASIYASDIRLADTALCSQDQALHNLSTPRTLQGLIFRDSGMCLSTNFTGALGNAIVTLQQYSGEGLANIANFSLDNISALLSGADNSFEDYLMGVIAPACLAATSDSAPEIVAIPDNLNCFEVSNPPYVPRSGSGSDTTDETARFALELAAARNSMNAEISRRLAQNTPIGIDICTAFFANPDANSNFGRSCDGTEPHGFHALNVTGQRCHNGRIQYQLLNSWGPTCNYLMNSNATPPVSNYECDENTGSFWVDEDVLVRNTMRMNYLSTETPPSIPHASGSQAH